MGVSTGLNKDYKEKKSYRELIWGLRMDFCKLSLDIFYHSKNFLSFMWNLNQSKFPNSIKPPNLSFKISKIV